MKKQVRMLMFAVLTVLLLVLAIVGVSAAGEYVVKDSSGTQTGAYDTLNAAVSAVTAGGTVEVQSSVSVSSTQAMSKSVSYTLKGKTGSEIITLTDAAYLNITAGTVTLENLNVTLTGTASQAIKTSGSVKLTVNSGRIATVTDVRTIYVSGSSSLTVNGGFFTFLDNMTESEIDPAATSVYANSQSLQNNHGLYLSTSGTVVIAGGTFMAGDSYYAVDARGSTKLYITGGNFYSYRDVVIYSTSAAVKIYGGNFSGNPGQANSKIIDIAADGGKVEIFGGTFSPSNLGGAPGSKEGIVFPSQNNTKIYIYGGTFNCASTNGGSGIVKLTTAGNTVTIDSKTETYNGTKYGGTPKLNKSGYGAAVAVVASGNTVTVNNGRFTATNLIGSLISVMGAGSTVNVKKGTYITEGTAAAIAIQAGNVTVSGGTFNSTGTNILLVAAEKGYLNITGGTYTLAESSVKGGTILRTTALVTNQQDLYQYYDPTTVYCASSIPITISGGRFIDQRTSNDKVFDTSLGTSKLTYTNLFILANSKQSYFIDVNDAFGNDVLMDNSNKAYYQSGVQYYAYIYSAETANAPVMVDGAAVELNPDYKDGNYNGIRFLSYIPASVAGTLSAGYTFGTLIAPADYVAAAGGFTHAKMNALYSNSSYGLNADTKPAYVDIPAVDTVAVDNAGNIHFSGALVYLKSTNLDRSFAAVAYIKLADGTYYYSKFDADLNARTMKDIAKTALTDYSEIVGGEDNKYINPSVYKPGAFSRYDDVTEQPLLQQYSGYYHTLTSTNVTFTNSYSVPVVSTASSNLKTTATAVANKLAGFAAVSGTPTVSVIVGAAAGYDDITSEALDEIGGEGYYIGVKYQQGSTIPRVVVIGTSNALTLQALQVFEKTYLKAGNVTVREIVHHGAGVITLNTDVPVLFAYTRDGNFTNPYTNPSISDAFKGLNFSPDSNRDHLYNTELNGYVYGKEGKLVDYPIVAGFEIGAALNACGGTPVFTDGYLYSFLPDNIAVNGFHIEIGLTDHAQNNVLKGYDYGVYGYSIKDGKITITAYDDATLRLAKELFISNIADFMVDGVYKIPVDFEYECLKTDGLTGAMQALETAKGTDGVAAKQLAKFQFITSVPRPALTLSGAADVGDNTLELYYNERDVRLSAYTAYCAALTKAGYQVYMAERAVESSRYVTYYNPTTGITLHVIYDAFAYARAEAARPGSENTLSEMFKPTLRVIAAKVDNNLVRLLPQNYLSIPTYTKKTDTMITNVQITENSFGYCYIYTLEDGSFVVLDGGGGGSTSDNVGIIYNTLVGLYTKVYGSAPSKTNKIKIAAWYLSHGHGDHYATMESFITSHVSASSGTVEMEAIIHNFPSNDEIYNAFDANPSTRNSYINGAKYQNSNGSMIPYYKVHTGQVFFIRNLQFEVLYTHEDIHPWAVEYYNNTTTVIRLTTLNTNGNGTPTAGSKSVDNMILGDLQVRGSMVMRARYGDYLKSDMALVSHHGGNGVEAALYQLIDAQVLWFTREAAALKSSTSTSGNSPYIKENVAWISTTRWLYIFTLNPMETPETTTTSGSGLSKATTTTTTYYNLTVTLTAAGFPGLYNRLEEDTAADLATKQSQGQAALLQNLFSMKVVKTYTKKLITSSTNWSSSAGAQNGHGVTFDDGNDYIVGRQGYSYELPITYPPKEKPLGDTAEDPFTSTEIPEAIWGW